MANMSYLAVRADEAVAAARTAMSDSADTSVGADTSAMSAAAALSDVAARRSTKF